MLVLIVAGWAVAGGLLQLYAGFQSDQNAGTRAAYILGGLATIALGVVLFGRPDMGAVTLALLFSMFNIIYGAWQLSLGIELRQTEKSLRVSRAARAGCRLTASAHLCDKPKAAGREAAAFGLFEREPTPVGELVVTTGSCSGYAGDQMDASQDGRGGHTRRYGRRARGPCEIAQRFRGVGITPRGAIWARQTLGELSVVTTSGG